MDSVNADIIGSLRIPLPPVAAQERTVAEVLLRWREIDTLISKAGQFIALAKERRAALITAAVTGQIDVTGKAA
jgi:type I restriction enzyme S subunit